MERLPDELWKRTFLWAIDRIAKQRMADTCHMNADLMGSSGFQPALYMGKCSKTF